MDSGYIVKTVAEIPGVPVGAVGEIVQREFFTSSPFIRFEVDFPGIGLARGVDPKCLTSCKQDGKVVVHRPTS